jgi:hypothetical protein
MSHRRHGASSVPARGWATGWMRGSCGDWPWSAPPAGSGKTALLADWTHRGKRTTAWLSLDAAVHVRGLRQCRRRHPAHRRLQSAAAGVGHAYEASLKEALAGHLTGRLDDLDETISRAESSLFGAIAELAPSGPWRQAIISLAQWEKESPPGSIDELLATRVRYGGADLAAWRQKVTGLREVSGRLELFAAFADIEDAFEPFEELMTDLDVRIELEEQRESDLRRGK